MVWILGTVAVVVLSVVLWGVGKHLRKSHNRESQSSGQGMLIAVPILLFLGVAGTAYQSVYQVPAGHVGVVYQFGAIKGQIEEGLNIIAPWRSAKIANVQIQRHIFTAEELSSFSQETQDVFVDATLNIRVTPGAIQELYRSVGPNYFDVLVRPRVTQNFKDETVKYKSVDIAPNRERIREVVRERLKRELAENSIEVVDLLIDDIDFRPEFKHAIEAKQIATQKALEEEQRVVVEHHRAKQAIERAQGEGGAILAVAEKQAEANRKLAESLTPELVQYALIQKLSDKIEVMILPAGQNFILSPDVFKKVEEKK